MPQILTLNENYVDGFEKLFTAYYTELDCGEDIPHLLDEYVIPDFKAGLISIQLLKDGEVFAGFVIYQKDDLNHEWNLREACGYVRGNLYNEELDCFVYEKKLDK